MPPSTYLKLGNANAGTEKSAWHGGSLSGFTYDLEIDTATTTPAENAELIRSAFGL